MGAHRNVANKREQERRQLREQRERDRRARADEKRGRRLERRHGQGIDDLIEESNRA